MKQRDWLWDRRIRTEDAARILKDPNHERFTDLAALLLARKNTPKEIFKEWLSPLDFCRHWPRIKRQMRKDQWSNPRIIFWQAIYERLRENYLQKGVRLSSREVLTKVRSQFCKVVGEKIKALRKEQGLTQQKLAKRLGISQQVISRVEAGQENLSLLTLNKIVTASNGTVVIEIQNKEG